MSKTLQNTRIRQKIDTSENWAKATNFIPLKGELIIYQDYDESDKPLSPKYKNGDGKTNVNDLPFSTNIEAGVGADTIQQTPRVDKVTIAESETTPHFSFTGPDEANMAGRIEYGAVGNYSASFNGRSAALNKHAFAINNSTIAKGEESFAQGYETIAEGNSSVATGSRTWAMGLASHTEGENTYAEGEGSHAEGALTKAIGRYSHAEGECTITNGDNSHSEGGLTQTGSFAAHAEGNATIADTNASHTEGSETKVVSYIIVNNSDIPDSGESSESSGPDYNEYESMEDFRQRAAACAHAEGNHSVAMNYGAHAEGVSTKAYGHSSHTEGWDTQTGELMTMEEDGQTYQIANPELGLGAHAEGYETQAIANYSHAEGFQTEATGYGAHAEGANTHATEMYAHAEGFYTHANGQSSHAEGESTIAEGQNSHAEGFNTKAAHGATHAEGFNVVAMADRSHAEGDCEPAAPETYDYTFTFDGKTYNGKDGAYGAYSHREGRNTLTLGDGSHVEGIGNIAHGLASHAEGFLTEANGLYSHASGLGTKASATAQTVVGKYNKEDNNALFVIGNGTDYTDESRSNAFVVDLLGHATLGADPEEAMHAVTKQYFDNAIGDMETALDAILAIQKELLPPQLITFTVNYQGNLLGEYEAVEGMTWGEWCESEYNPTRDLEFNKIYIHEDYGKVYIDITGVQDENNIFQSADTVIINGATYRA